MSQLTTNRIKLHPPSSHSLGPVIQPVFHPQRVHLTKPQAACFSRRMLRVSENTCNKRNLQVSGSMILDKNGKIFNAEVTKYIIAIAVAV